MNTNDTLNNGAENQIDLTPLIESISKSMGEEYFMEFLHNEANSIRTSSPSFLNMENFNTNCSDTFNQEKVCPLSENDYSSALYSVLNSFEEVPCLNLSQGSAPLPGFTDSLISNEAKLDLSKIPSFSVPDLGLLNDVLDVNLVRKDFPILSEKINGKNLVWFDNAATTQKPKSVIDRLKYFYEHENSNVHRGAHTLAKRTTEAYEGARAKVAKFLNADNANEIVFVRGTTEAINLVAQTYGVSTLSPGDEVIISLLDHHANIVPWQMVCLKTGATLKAIPVDEDGQIILSEYEKLLSEKTKIVSLTHVSNAIGTIVPVSQIIDMAHRYNAKVLIDGAQAVAHMGVDVKALSCDFYTFSAHKIFGPTGIGVLYAKAEILDSMQPYQGGGNMIEDVTIEKTTYKSPPHRFEAGTGSIAAAIGLGAAIDYVTKIGTDAIFEYELKLLKYGTELLKSIPGITIIGNAKEKTSIISFILKGFLSQDVGNSLDKEGIAVRAGHHCAQPILKRYGLNDTVRVSTALYNTKEELDYLAFSIWKLKNSKSYL